MNDKSFIKGEAFEEYVSKNIFTEDEYDLIYKTNSYEQNKNRYSKDSLKPDFKFECRKSNKCFYVEAKFRTGFNNHNKIELLTLQQYQRFIALENEEKCPIYIIIGYGGYAQKPENISLIPLKDIVFLTFYYSALQKFKINIEPLPYTNLKLEDYNLTPIDNKIEELIPENKFSLLKNKAILIIAAIIIVFLGFAFIKLYNNESEQIAIETSNQNEIKTVISDYYKELDNNQLNNLNKYINPVVSTWFSKSNLTLEDIIKQQIEYQKKYPLRKTSVIWETFNVDILGNEYQVTYHLDYKLKSRNSENYKTYKLKIFSVWDSNYKLKSMSEVKL